VSDIQKTADVSAAETAVSASAQLKSRGGFQTDGISKEGDPKSIIVDYAKEWGADLIV
jgi:nucleotide-binding universal stress UspA family protein